MFRNALTILSLLTLGSTASFAAILLEIDISDPSAVTFTATSNNASSDSSLNASSNGFTIEGFFLSNPTVDYIDGNVTGTLSPVTGTTQTYAIAGTFDYLSGTETFGPGNDLNVTANGNAGSNSQVFSTSSTAFTGTAVMDLSSYVANLPLAGASGSIYPGYSLGPAVIGEWSVVPEPSTYALGAGMLALCALALRQRLRA